MEIILDALHNTLKKFISNYTHHLIGDLSKRLKIFLIKKESLKLLLELRSGEESLVVSELLLKDASSILIWASYLETESLLHRFNNYPNSGDMKRYKDILVSDDPIELTKFNNQ